ncbi:MAG: hypothetical protein R3Y18_02410 [Bacillota bacterium]
MTTLAKFIGEIVDDIGKARSYADYSSAVLAEKYYADPFIKSLPVPHYTIDEVEVEVPVTVVGVKSSVAKNDEFKEEFIEKITETMPHAVFRSLKTTLHKHNTELAKKQEERHKSKRDFKADANIEESTANENGDHSSENAVLSEGENAQVMFADMTMELVKHYYGIAKDVTKKTMFELQKFLNGYNFEVLKILEVKDFYAQRLFENLKGSIARLDKDFGSDFSETEISEVCNTVSRWMFFEFKKIISKDMGVQISVETSKMNEFAGSQDTLMHIKVKMKEQDLSLLVEDKDGEEFRYLSLT